MPIWKFTKQVKEIITEGGAQTFTYSTGEIGLSLTPEHSESISFAYLNEIGLSSTPESLYEATTFTIWTYGGEIGLSLTPEHSESISFAYLNEIGLSLTPEHSESISFAYLNEIGLSSTPESLYEATLPSTWIYDGEIGLSLTPEHSESISFAYLNEIGLSSTPESLKCFIVDFVGLLDLTVGIESYFPFSLIGGTEFSLECNFDSSYSCVVGWTCIGLIDNTLTLESYISNIWCNTEEIEILLTPESYLNNIWNYTNDFQISLSWESTSEFRWTYEYLGETGLSLSFESYLNNIWNYINDFQTSLSWETYSHFVINVSGEIETSLSWESITSYQWCQEYLGEVDLSLSFESYLNNIWSYVNDFQTSLVWESSISNVWNFINEFSQIFSFETYYDFDEYIEPLTSLRCLSFDFLDNIELPVNLLLLIQGDSTDKTIGWWWFGKGTSGNETGYLIMASDGRIRWLRYDNGDQTILKTYVIGGAGLNNNVRYFWRIQVPLGGNQVNFKVWRYDEEEPLLWSFEGVDPSPLISSGWWGVCTNDLLGNCILDRLCVGVNGEVPSVDYTPAGKYFPTGQRISPEYFLGV